MLILYRYIQTTMAEWFPTVTSGSVVSSSNFGRDSDERLYRVLVHVFVNITCIPVKGEILEGAMRIKVLFVSIYDITTRIKSMLNME